MISEATISIQLIKSTNFSLKKKSIKDLNTKRKVVIKNRKNEKRRKEKRTWNSRDKYSTSLCVLLLYEESHL